MTGSSVADEIPSPSRAPILRFAPSPNGTLHLGHAYSALLNARMARETGGTLLLRMEDIDRERCRPDYVAAIEEDLRWLGLEWSLPVRVQSAHLPTYSAVLDGLARRGLVYPCFCTRGTIQAVIAGRPGWPADPDGAPLYPGTCKAMAPAERAWRLASGQAPSFRLDMDRALALEAEPLDWLECGEAGDRPRHVLATPAAWGDALIGRRDVPTSYHLAVVTDDAAQGVTDVVRGQDLFRATGLHRLLQRLVGVEAPRYHHHRLILDETGRKLSKSRQAPSLRALRLAGQDPAAVRRRLGFA